MQMDIVRPRAPCEHMRSPFNYWANETVRFGFPADGLVRPAPPEETLRSPEQILVVRARLSTTFPRPQLRYNRPDKTESQPMATRLSSTGSLPIAVTYSRYL
jgi:hypothetical protein